MLEENLRILLPRIKKGENMSKDALLKSIANKAYNIGFGAQKHFASYHFYSQLPRLLSIATILVGIFQLINVYKSISATTQDIISAFVIIIGVIALVLDAGSKDKTKYNEVGKKLTKHYNDLHFMYNKIKSSSDTEDFSSYESKIEEIENDFQAISLSDQVSMTHIYTNLVFFFAGPQIDWLDEQLHFKAKDKFPFLHPEAFLLYIIVTALLAYIIYHIINKCL